MRQDGCAGKEIISQCVISVIVGALLNVYPLTNVSEPKSFVTTTSTVPGLCAGVSHVIVDALTTVTFVAEEPSKDTVVVPADAKSVPLIITEVPPPWAPLSGEIPVMSGGL